MDRLAALLLLSLALVCRAADEAATEWVALRGSRSTVEVALQGVAEASDDKDDDDKDDDDDDGADENGVDSCEASRELCGDYCTYNLDGEGRQRCEESPECRVLDVKDFGGKAGDDGWLCESADTKCREFEVLSPEHFTCQNPGADAPQWEDDSAYFDESEEDVDTAVGAEANEATGSAPAAGNASALQAALAEPVAALEPQVAVGSRRCHRGRETQRLFHLTDRSACEAILHGGFKIGRPGIAGRGVYFAVSPTDTFGKAECPACKGETHERPCMIEAVVRVGKSKRIPFRGDRGLTGPKLWSRCYDSAWIPRGHPHGSKPEYVVYNPRQVHSLCVYPVNRYGQAVGERRCTH